MAPTRDADLPPPTLAPAAALVATPTPEPPPAPVAASPPPSPPASPGIYPIISQIRPVPGAELPPGEVTIAARVTGSSTLVDVQTFLDGEPLGVDLRNQSETTVNVSIVRELASGPHEVRIQARDQHGQLGGYRWQFVVGPRQAAPTAPRNTPIIVPRTLSTVPPTREPAARPRATPVASPRPR